MTARLATLALAALLVGCRPATVSPSSTTTTASTPEHSASARASAASSQAPSAVAKGTLLRVQNPGLRMRADPSTDGDLLRALPEGAVVSVVSGPTQGEGHDWYEVRHGALTGWVASGEDHDWLAIIRNGRVAFACIGCTEDRAGSLMTVNVDGTDPQIIKDAFAVPVWSPDGSRLAVTIQPVAGDFNSVELLTPEGEVVEALDEGFGPAWSPDGSRLAFTDPGERAIELYEDGEQVALTVTDHGSPTSLHWSPDGQTLVFVGIDCPACPIGEPIFGDPAFSIFAFDPPGGAVERLANGGNTGIVDISPDGSVITYIELNLGTGDLEVLERDLAADVTTVRLSGMARYGYAVSPDGSQLAIGTQDGIVVSDRDGANPTVVVPFVERAAGLMPQHPRWSPDGQWILYDIVAINGDAIHPAIVRADGSDGHRLVDHDGYEAAWQPVLEALP